MKDNVAVMTEVFRTAMIFEQHKYVWDQSLLFVNQKLTENENEQKKQQNNIREDERIITHIEENFVENTRACKEEYRKYRRNATIIYGLLALMIVVSIVSLVVGWPAVAYILFEFEILMAIIAFFFSRNNRGKREQFQRSVQWFSPESAVSGREDAKVKLTVHTQSLSFAKQQRELLQVKREAIIVEHNKAVAVLKEIYGKGWIPERYRGLVQTATIYGYLRNGICTVIRGHGGVYERYEDDLHHQEIVGHLKDIKRLLHVVIRNQLELKRVLESIDATMYGIKQELSASNETLKDIRTNSSIAAASAQQSASYQSYIATAVWRNM